jgi:O-antigen biosynthesis alpha-1,3-abequosyltransferase
LRARGDPCQHPSVLEPRLSIGIPVYNFGAFLGETLGSIVPQLTDEVEILVVDGASTDDTADVVRRFQERCPQLHYHRLDRRGGIDRDIAETVALARGGYCWLFAGDDLMVEGAVADVLGQIRLGYDVYVCESVLCHRDMAPIGKHRLLASEVPRVFQLGDPDQRAKYFALARNTAAFFSFCSSLIFKKARWDAVGPDERFMRSHWGHVARFFRMIPDGLTVKYLPEPHLRKRGENDSFMAHGLVHRYGITIDGFTRLADTFFGHASDEARHIRRTIQAEHNLKSLLDAKLMSRQKGSRSDLETLDRLVSILYVDESLATRAKLWAYRYTPSFVLSIAKPAYRFVRQRLAS